MRTHTAERTPHSGSPREVLTWITFIELHIALAERIATKLARR